MLKERAGVAAGAQAFVALDALPHLALAGALGAAASAGSADRAGDVAGVESGLDVERCAASAVTVFPASAPAALLDAKGLNVQALACSHQYIARHDTVLLPAFKEFAFGEEGRRRPSVGDAQTVDGGCGKLGNVQLRGTAGEQGGVLGVSAQTGKNVAGPHWVPKPTWSMGSFMGGFLFCRADCNCLRISALKQM